jgi:AcrR family transcriptional regulator
MNVSQPPARRILEAGKWLFAAKGYEQTTTVMIARQAGTSESQIIKHFQSKQGVLEAIFNEGWSRIAQQLEGVRSISSGYERLEVLVSVVLSAFYSDAALKELLLFEGRRMRKEGSLMLTNGYLSLVHMVDECLGQIRSSGGLKPELNPQALRSAVMGMFEGMLRDQLLGSRGIYPADYSLESIRLVFRHVLKAFLVTDSAHLADSSLP